MSGFSAGGLRVDGTAAGNRSFLSRLCPVSPHYTVLPGQIGPFTSKGLFPLFYTGLVLLFTGQPSAAGIHISNKAVRYIFH